MQFWPFYLRQHAKQETRLLHYVGSTAALTVAGASLAAGKYKVLPLVLLAGYGPAWFSHARVERNRPATFTYPLWSLASDFRMYFLWLAGRLNAELEKAGVTSGTVAETVPEEES
eukprot:jgi/Astpho2/3536/Aster-06448